MFKPYPSPAEAPPKGKATGAEKDLAETNAHQCEVELRPISVLRFWTSEGLTQAES